MDLLAARSIMGFSLGFHIIFACIGMVMPFFMFASYLSYLKTNSQLDLELTKMWSKGVAIFFAVGAVSGTVLSFELGLLWPKFMKVAGPIIGMPFSLEGTAFFLEAIALGIFLYGWKKIPIRWHLVSALMVGISGVASGIFILSANSWMNHPTGFDWIDGMAMNIRPLHALFNSGWFYQTIHMIPASFVAVGLAVAGIHGYFLLKERNKALNLKAVHIALSYACFFALVVPVTGHFSAQHVAATQPEKFAAMEKIYEGGWGLSYNILGIKIPGLLSFLATNDFNGMVQGLESMPAENIPPVNVTHTAFLIMVTIGSFLFLMSLYYFYIRYRKKSFPKIFWKGLPFCAPLGFVALESGWVVTEVGRQPWILYHVIRTHEAVTPMPGLWFHFLLFFSIYCTLAFLTFWLMKRLILQYQNAK